MNYIWDTVFRCISVMQKNNVRIYIYFAGSIHKIHIHIVKILQSIPRFEVDRENTSVKKQIVTKRHNKIHRGRWLPDQNSRPFSDPDYIWHKCHPSASTGIQNYQILLTKTFSENWDSKAPSVRTPLAYLETTT